jgi:asparagine synthase (glutamine-hydrolysing)
MCGIAGVAGPLRIERLEAAIQRMNAALVHRGPDDEGAWVEPGFGFGMRRLSIIDLAGGRQPMFDPETGIGVVYNGELYNYRALRKELEKEGEQFSTTSDTEIILKSLARKGPKAVHEWNGMFAVASWDKRAQKLHLIRDRIGIKPLYYYWDGTSLLFASEIKALLASGLFQPKLNCQAIWDYLTFRYVPGPQTMWQDIWKLPPGHILTWSPGRDPELERYWQTDVLSGNGASLEEALGEFEELFLDSVQQQLLAADVPVGVLLSGGLDSSAIAAAAVELGHRDFHTFSVGFTQGEKYSELPYARLVAKHVGAQYHEVVLDRDIFLEMLPDVVRATDEPLADLPSVPLLAVSRLARQWVKVVLSGEGSDEILGGYDFDVAVREWKRIKRLQSLPPFLLQVLARPLGIFPGKYAELARRIAHVPLSGWNAHFKVHMTRFWQQQEKRSLWPQFSGLDSDRILDGLYATAASPHPLDQVLSVYQRSWLVDDLLLKADKMTMAASLELRVPFLDHRLVEWANRQSSDLKVRRVGTNGHITKYALRRFAAARLPEEIIRRPKRGFPVPAFTWFQDESFFAWARDRVLGPHSTVRKFLSDVIIEDQLLAAGNGNTYAAHRAWLFIVLELWLRLHRPHIEELVG